MNLQFLKSALPKSLNIASNSIRSSISYGLTELCLGTVVTNNGTGTLNITAAELVNGTLGANGAATLTIQLPTATAINAFLPSDTPSNTSFKFRVYASATPGPVSAVNIVLATGVTTYNGATSIPLATGTSRTLVFAKSGTSWVVYF